MRRIAYLTSEYPARSHTFIRREIAALRSRGLMIMPVSIRPSSVPDEEMVPTVLQSKLLCLWNASMMLVRAPFRSVSTWQLGQTHRVAGVRGWLWAQFHVLEALALARILSQFRVEHLHSHFANSGATVGMLAAHLLDVPWSLTLHGISETDPPAGALLQAKLKRAHFVACASWFMRAQAMRILPTEMWPRLHVVRCGVDLSNLPAAPDRPAGPRRGALHFVTVGRLSAEKGLSGLLQAFGDLIRNGLDARLTIVGEGPLRSDLEDAISNARLGDRVVLTGALSENDTLARIAEADIFVLASLMEGLPVVLMEAMAMAKPVIAPAVAGIPELITDASSGLLFRVGDWDQLGRCMQNLAQDENMCDALRLCGRERVKAEFEINAAVAPLEALFTGRDEDSCGHNLPLGS